MKRSKVAHVLQMDKGGTITVAWETLRLFPTLLWKVPIAELEAAIAKGDCPPDLGAELLRLLRQFHVTDRRGRRRSHGS